ncbi:MAG: PA2778 family cysteine peptidase, partial [Halofilum sp. (in: g-proteobacteria)]
MTTSSAPRRGIHAAGLTLLIAVLAGCAHTPQTRQLVEQPPDSLPSRAELTEVPFFAQQRYQCGPAALAMLLTNLDHPTSPSELVDEVYIPERQGSLRPEMRAAVRARGFIAYPLEPELRALFREIAEGRPVLVMQNLGLDWAPLWHYAVAVGYDLPEREIILRSGTTERHVTTLATFERTWARSGHWAQVVAPPDRPPATAEALAWLEAARELETTDQTKAARTAYRAATERWPDSRTAWMAHGNAAYAAERHEEARDAFAHAVELQPESADGWNNLAHALATTDCGAAAVSAARCAVAVADDPAGPQETLDELEA